MNLTPPDPMADTGPILLPSTVGMPRIKPLPPNLAWELATLRPHLELMTARFADLMAAIERAAQALAAVRVLLDEQRAMTANQRVAEGII